MAGRAADLRPLRWYEDLAGAAEFDPEALKELGRESEKLARRANQRMRELESRGMTGDAYKRIRASLGGNTRFSQKRTGSADELLQNIKQSLRGLRQVKSTVSGAVGSSRKTLDTLKDKWDIAGRVSKDKINKFNEFVKSDLWNEYKSLMGGSGGVLEQFTKMLFDDPQSVDDVLDAFNEWDAMTEDEPDPYEAMSEWFEIY